MARTRAEWEALAYDIIVDVFQDRLVMPWKEVETRVSWHGWRQYDKPEPVHLTNPRRALLQEGKLVRDTTEHNPPVVTYRIPFPEGSKREIERLRGARRKLYRKYLSWTQDRTLCGRHAEIVAMESLQSAASPAGLWVPEQAIGQITQIKEAPTHIGPLDLWAHILEVNQVDPIGEIALAIEVKNTYDWIYPWAKQLWQLLVKAAQVAIRVSVVPVLMCFRYGFIAGQFAKDIGFLLCPMRRQVFSPRIDNRDFQEVVDEFRLLIELHSGPQKHVYNFLTKTLRHSPPPSPPWEEEIPWYKRQADRFRSMAPVILAYQILAQDLQENARRNTFAAFKAQAKQLMTWPSAGRW